MYRAVLLAALVAVAAGGRSPNADLVEEYLKTHKGARFSTDVIEDALLDAPSLIRKYGYPVEVHHVVTTDGYVLEAHRIPHGRDRNNQPSRNKPVVLIMHGLLSSSADFLVLGPGNALAYLLAEEGFDVWLGNARGNYYSRRHIHMDPNDRSNPDFWRFSWEQIGMFDLPAFIDYALLMSGQPRLHYIGHSQGGTAFLVLNSMRPEYNAKFTSFQGFAPASFFYNSEHAIFNFLAPYEKLLETAALRTGFVEILPNSPLTTWVGSTFCSEESAFHPLCAFMFIYGGAFENFNSTMIPKFLGHSPAGASILQVTHYGQTIRRGSFARFYFDPFTNLRLYGRINPPEFDMSLITVPAYLHYGVADREVDYRDLHVLGERLSNTVGLFRAERATFNHYDFIWGGKVKEEMFDQLFELMWQAERA